MPHQSSGADRRTDRHSRSSMVTLLPWGWAAWIPRRDASSLAAGCWPRRRVPQQSAPACPGHIPGSRCQALDSGDGGVDGDETPQVKHVPCRNGDLDTCRCPWALSPAPSAALSWLRIHCAADACQTQTPAARVRAGRDVSAEDRRRPLLSANDHPVEKCDPSHMAKAARAFCSAHRQSPGDRRLATRIVIPRPHPGSRGDEQSADRAREPNGAAESAATDASAAARPSRRLPGCVPPRCWSRSSAPGLQAESRSGAREAGRPGCWPGHRVARDRRPAGCD